ncbi:MAG: NAD-dependent epimerase/dehydratase family protein [Flavobacteriales bacterium]|nr:NAD-dependent epimerase/dehydratase family protein [Flavobacteriales bacterium]MCB9204497.1 NAD-dependent epimerase/dehydratase family protein [Flavobacteriales bacterium]
MKYPAQIKNKILVTGGAGFIGSAVAEKLAKDPENYVVIVDSLLTGSIKKVPTSEHNNLRFIKCDANNYKDISSVFYAYTFDYVFHYAAVVGVKRTLQNPVMVLADITGIDNILSLSKNTGVKRVYYSSSSEVYGEPVEFPQNEHTTPLNSRLPYAIVKNVGEAYLKSYEREFGLEYTIFRFFNTYGPKQSKEFVISRFLSMALQNENITIYGDGSQTRTFCFINDNVDACVAAFYNDMYVNDVVNIGGNIEVPILELANIIIKVTGSKSKVIHLPALEEGDMTRRLPDTSKMKTLLNREVTTLEDGLKEVIQHGQFISLI